MMMATDGSVTDSDQLPLLAVVKNPERGHFWQRDVLPCFPTRYVIVIITFVGFMIVYALRINLSMAIVAMVNASADNSTHLQYSWTSAQQGWVLSAFYYGYLVTQIPGGYLADIFGARYVFGLGILLSSVLTIFTPLAAELHIVALISLRVLIGLFEGVTYPAVISLLGKWSPPKERSIIYTMTYAGCPFGSIISFPLSAILCEYGFAGGWPSVFYTFGVLGIIWFFFWLYLAYDSPAKHPRVSKAERLYIETTIEEEGSDKIMENTKIPWLQIAVSPAVWAIVIAFICNTWGFYTLLTCIPSYYSDVLDLTLGKNLLQNGAFSAIPYIGYLLASLIGGHLADYLRAKGVATVIVRKSFTTLAFLVAAGALLIIGYIGSSKIISVVLITVSVAFSGLITAGPPTNQMDIAPQFAGVLMGISNMAGTVPGIIGPFIAKTIAHIPSDGPGDTVTYREEWREVFIIAAELYIFGAIVYIILGRGERQSWAGGAAATTANSITARKDNFGVQT